MSLLTKLFMAGQIRFEDGKLQIMGESTAMIPMSFITEITRVAIQQGKSSFDDLYFETWIAGYKLTTKLTENFKLKKFEDRYKLSMDFVSLGGFGAYTTIDFKRGEYSHFRNHKNPLALSLYPSNRAVDYFLMGANAGGGTVVHERLINCIELDCAAMNGEYCEFLNARNSILKKNYPKLVEEQLDLKYLTKKQMKFIKEQGDDFKK